MTIVFFAGYIVDVRWLHLERIHHFRALGLELDVQGVEYHCWH